MEQSGASMECADKKPPPSTTKKTRPCVRFVGGDNQHGAFRGEQLRFPCKLRRYICARCGVHRHGEIRDELLPPRKRYVFRRLVRFKARKEKKRDAALELEDQGVIWNWASHEVTKGERGPRRKRADVMCVDWLRDC